MSTLELEHIKHADLASGNNISLTSAGNVGIGTVSPTSPLHITGSGHTALTITGGAGSDAQIRFGDSANTTIGMINYDNAIDALKFVVNGSTAAIIDNGGRAIIVGGVTLGNGSTYAAANTLDDYEEGYYDPSVSAYGTSGAFGFAGASNTLAYTKIGRTVHVQGYISITDMSGTDTGHLIMSIPFASATLNDDCGYNLSSVLLQNHGGSITGNVYLFVIGSTAYFYKVQTDGSAGYIMVQDIDTTFQIGVSFTYLAA